MELTTNIKNLITETQKAPVEKRNTNSLVLKAAQFGFSTVGRIFPSKAAQIAYNLFTTPRIRARHKKSDKVLESARIFEFMYAKHILKGYEWGEGEKTILLVHGWESRGTAMRSFVPKLVSDGYKVVAFDGPAHGNSAGNRTNLPHFGGSIKAIIHYVGGVHGIITHSFGGASTVFSLANIDNSISIEKLVLIGVPSSMINLSNDFLSMIKAPPSVARRFEKILESKIDMPLESAHMSNSFEKIKVGKTLVIHDRHDQVVPYSEATAVAETWKDTSLLVTENLGHFQLLKNPDLIDRVSSFMAE